VRLDDHMPSWDERERHAALVDAPPEQTLAAARSLPFGELRLATALMAIRSLPGLVGGRVPKPGPPSTSVMESFERLGFAVLEETPRELVVGGIGRFWRVSGNVRRIDAGEFAGFTEPGYAKAVFNVEAVPHGDGCVLVTETRVAGTDAAATRSFRRYWRLVYPGSAAIRLAWLRAIRQRAEAGA